MRNEKACVSDPNAFITCAGSNKHQLYSSKVMEDGTVLLTPAGTEDIQELINSHLEETDIYYITQRLAMGDVSGFTDKTAMYGDFTNTPKDMRHAMQIMIDGEKQFYELPLDVRQKFDNDFKKFIVSAGTEDWYSKLDVEQPYVDQQNEVKEEVKE